MKKVLRIMMAFLLCIGLIGTMPAPAFADSDTVAPEPDINSITVSSPPDGRDYFMPGDTITITLDITETGTGVKADYGYVKILERTDDSGKYEKDLHITGRPENGLSGNYTIEYLLDENSFPTGSYNLTCVELKDNAGNYSSTETYPMDIPWGGINWDEIPGFKVVNNERTDWDGPELISITPSKTTIKPNETITFAINAQDAGGHGLTESWMQIYDADDELYCSLFSTSEGCSPTSLIYKIPSSMVQGDYYVRRYYLYDSLRNLTEEYSGHYADFTVVNSAMPVKQYPVITDFQIRPENPKQGDPITFTATIDPKGYELGSTCNIGFKRAGSFVCNGISLSKVDGSDGQYTTAMAFPVYWPATEYTFEDAVRNDLQSTISIVSDGEAGTTTLKWTPGLPPQFTLQSIFSGTENVSLLVGDSFDPMEGVTAVNESEGNRTADIQVSGSVDTSQKGLYLLKYTVESTNPDSWYGGTYSDFRWVGVTEIMPDSPDDPLVLTNDPIAIETGGEDVDITKDGVQIGDTSTVSEQGTYNVSLAEGDGADLSFRARQNSKMRENINEKLGAKASAASDHTAAGPADTLQSGDVQQSSVSLSKESVTAVIDKSAPSIKATWSANTSGSLTVTVSATDASGVAQMKYMAGEYSLGSCKTGGTPFTKTFTAPTYGKYTVYSRDKLGNEGVSVITVTSPTPSAYLYSISLSAGSLNKSFSKKSYSYKISLAENQSGVTLTPIKEYSGATMKIAGKSVSSYTVSLSNGKSATIKVQVKYGRTTKTYKFTVTRAKSTNNNLATLTASAGTFDKAFSASATSYTLTLDENTKSVTIKDTVATSLAKASFKSKKVTLSNGQTKVVKLTVKAQSGAKKTYTITVTRAKSTNTGLKYLKTNSKSYPLSPAYSAGTMSYTITLPVNKSSVTISAKALGYKAAVYFDGAKKSSKRITLQAGQSTVVAVKVVAQSGASKTFTVTVQRQISSDATLKTLKASGLSPRFSPGVTNYTIALAAKSSSVTISAPANGYGAAVYFDGVKKSSRKVTLASGQSVTVRISVKAQAGNTKDYYVTVTRP